jgi:hypothetical protein
MWFDAGYPDLLEKRGIPLSEDGPPTPADDSNS